jgi:hypothetical protein
MGRGAPLFNLLFIGGLLWLLWINIPSTVISDKILVTGIAAVCLCLLRFTLVEAFRETLKERRESHEEILTTKRKE